MAALPLEILLQQTLHSKPFNSQFYTLVSLFPHSEPLGIAR